MKVSAGIGHLRPVTLRFANGYQRDAFASRNMTEMRNSASLDKLLELEARISGGRPRSKRKRSDPSASECYLCDGELGPDATIYRARLDRGRALFGRSWGIEAVCEGCAPDPSRGDSWWWDSEPQPCQVCERGVVNRVSEARLERGWRHVFCSRDCERRYFQDRQRRIRRRTLDLDKTCDGCTEPFTAARSDARYCSPACRQRAYRLRAEAGELSAYHVGTAAFPEIS